MLNNKNKQNNLQDKNQEIIADKTDNKNMYKQKNSDNQNIKNNHPNSYSYKNILTKNFKHDKSKNINSFQDWKNKYEEQLEKSYFKKAQLYVGEKTFSNSKNENVSNSTNNKFNTVNTDKIKKESPKNNYDFIDKLSEKYTSKNTKNYSKLLKRELVLSTFLITILCLVIYVFQLLLNSQNFSNL